MFERIVVPLDGSTLSTQAITYATEVGKRFGSEIILVRVISPDDLALIPEVQAADNSNSTDIIQREDTDDADNAAYAKRYLTNWSQSLKSQGVKASFFCTGHRCPACTGVFSRGPVHFQTPQANWQRRQK